MTYLVYHVNKGLCLVPGEAANRVNSIIVREGHLEEGEELIWEKLAPDQASKGWSFGSENESESFQHSI